MFNDLNRPACFLYAHYHEMYNLKSLLMRSSVFFDVIYQIISKYDPIIYLFEVFELYFMFKSNGNMNLCYLYVMRVLYCVII